MTQEQPNRSLLYTVTEGFDGEFIAYTVERFTDAEISRISASIREGKNSENFTKLIDKARYAIEHDHTIRFIETFTRGVLELNFSQIDTIKVGEQTAYGLFGKTEKIAIYMEHPKDGVNLNLFYHNSSIMIYCDRAISQEADMIRYVIPNLEGQEFSRDENAKFIDQLDITYPKIKHPYACLYGILPDIFSIYGPIKWFRPNNIVI